MLKIPKSLRLTSRCICIGIKLMYRLYQLQMYNIVTQYLHTLLDAYTVRVVSLDISR